MSDDINILILSCGTRNKIVQYFKRELKGIGRVIATDCSNLAPALYEADDYYIVSKISEKNYINEILSICRTNNIKAVMTLIDPELNLLVTHEKRFIDEGIIPIISDKAYIDLSFDKYAMYSFLKQNQLPAIDSYTDKELFYRDIKKGKIDYPVFVKPILGSASIGINKAYSQNEIELLFERSDNLMIQKYINGKEYGIDAYIDLISGEVSSLFIKEKIRMRAGETDKSVSVINKKLSQLIKNFLEKCSFKGVIDIDVFQVENEFYISEINPRFGGGYPHAYECGVNFPRMIIENLKGNTNIPEFDNYRENTYMMKYNDVVLRK